MYYWPPYISPSIWNKLQHLAFKYWLKICCGRRWGRAVERRRMSSFLPVDIEFASECLRFLFTRRPAQRHLHHTHSHSNSDTFTHKLTHIFIIASYYFQLNHPDHHEQVVSTSLPDPPPLWTEMDALPLLHCSTTTPILYYSTTLLLLLSLHYSTFTTITTTTIIHLLYGIHHFKCCVSPSAQPDTFTVTFELFHLNYVNPQQHLQLHLNCVQMLIFYIIQSFVQFHYELHHT